jgi:hypothetical protein
VARISRLQAPAISGKLGLPGQIFPGSPDMQTRLSRRVFALWVLVWRPRVKGAVRAADSARPASLHQYPAQSNPAGYPLVRKAVLHLEDIAGGTVFLGIRTIQEPSRRNGAALCCAGAGRGSGSNGTKSTIGDTGTARRVSFPQKAYPRASGTTISGGEKRRLMIEHIANMSSPEDPPCLIFRTP